MPKIHNTKQKNLLFLNYLDHIDNLNLFKNPRIKNLTDNTKLTS